MKKRVLGIALAIVSMGFVVSAEAKTTNGSQVNSTLAANAAPQWQRDRYGRRYERRDDRRYNRRRTVTQSR